MLALCGFGLGVKLARMELNHSSASSIQVGYSAIGDWMRQYSVRL